MGIHTYASKIADIRIFEQNNMITRVVFNPKDVVNDDITPLTTKTKLQIEEYLNGSRKTFDLPLVIDGSEFQKKILNTMLSIPYGEKWSYSKLAKIAGFEGASRACGTVCKNNKLPIIIPCHRVIKSDGAVGKYNGGAELKERLLNLESYFQY
jgi:methylated-DNA-[protein]-cysteine S-methyltransferase